MICACRPWRWVGTALIMVLPLWGASSTASVLGPKPFIPALGLTYQPNQSWKLDLVLPRPAVTYFASRQLQLFVAGDFTSDEYELKGRQFGAKAIKYSDIKAMVGVNYLPVPAVKISTAIGHTFDRKFVFYDGALNRPDLRMDNVPFFKVSLDVGW